MSQVMKNKSPDKVAVNRLPTTPASCGVCLCAVKLAMSWDGTKLDVYSLRWMWVWKRTVIIHLSVRELFNEEFHTSQRCTGGSDVRDTETRNTIAAFWNPIQKKCSFHEWVTKYLWVQFLHVNKSHLPIGWRQDMVQRYIFLLNNVSWGKLKKYCIIIHVAASVLHFILISLFI